MSDRGVSCLPLSPSFFLSLGLGSESLRPPALSDRAKQGRVRSSEDAAADGGDGGGADDGEGHQGRVPLGDPPQAHPGRRRLQGRVAPQVRTYARRLMRINLIAAEPLEPR